jgi:hypothetical protein
MRWFKGLLSLVVVAVLSGCGGSGGIDENKPIDQVAAEAAEMSKEKLQGVVAEYEGLISEKAEQLKGLEAQIKDLSISELMGEKAKTIKEDTKTLSTSLSKLKDQMEVYAKQLSSAAE